MQNVDAPWPVTGAGRRRRLMVVPVLVGVAAALAGCGLLGQAEPAPTVTVTMTTTPTPSPMPTPTPTATPTAEVEPAPEPAPPPPPPLPPTAPNEMGGETDGGNTPNTPVVSDSGAQDFAVGPATQVNGYEYSYVVQKGDQVLAIASRFQLQTEDVVRVNFPCSDPLEVQPGDVLDIRWPLPAEQVGAGC